jgi:hypothetical protein
MTSPLEQLPQELQNQIMSNLGVDDLSSLGQTSTTMMTSVWAYLQPILDTLQAQAQAMVDQTAQLLADLPQYFQ